MSSRHKCKKNSKAWQVTGHQEGVSVSWGCCDKAAQRRQLKHLSIYPLHLEASSRCQQGWIPWGSVGESFPWLGPQVLWLLAVL